MARSYRGWEERREIARSIIASSPTRPIASFNLTPDEESYFRARTARLVDQLARRSASFKTYYRLRAFQPFAYVASLAALVILCALVAIAYLLLGSDKDTANYPLLGALGTIAAGALGWAVGAWIAHRNAVRKNTNDLLFARFSLWNLCGHWRL